MNPHPDEDLTVEEILAAADDTAPESLSAKLDAIRHTTTDAGVHVTVDLHGKLVDLRFDHQATRLHPDELATKIKQLTDKATAAALAEAMAALTGVLPDETLLSDLAGTSPARSPKVEPGPS